MATADTEIKASTPGQLELDGPPTKTYAAAAKELLDTSMDDAAPLEQYSGRGEDDAPRSPVRKMHKRNSSSRMNGHVNGKAESMSQLIVEKFQDKDGEHLTTVKQIQRNGKPQAQRRDELVSGRRVGTKWERSQYARSFYIASRD